jgi:EmrB/QacA subfamily drug resistance transporter
VRVAIVVVLGAIMSTLDMTIVNVALHDLSLDLHASLAEVQWVATGYMLALAAMLPVTSWATRRVGARRLYLIALVVFTAGSGLCGLAWSSGSLIAFRLLQGLAGGIITPVGTAILVKASSPRALPRVMSAVGVPIVLAPILGPTIGGLLLDHAGWQWIFLVNVPIGVVALWAAVRLLPRDAPEAAGPLDLPGLLLAGPGVAAITYGLAESGTAGSLVAGRALAPLLVGLALVGAFVVRSLRIRVPLLDLRLYADRGFRSAAIAIFALGGAQFGTMILVPLYFQTVRGESTVDTGLLLIPQGVGAMVAMRAIPRLTERFGAGTTALGGSILTVVGTLPFAFVDASTSYVLLSAVLILRGLGIVTATMPAMSAAFARLRRDQVDDASPQLIVLQRVGGSMSVAVLTVVLQGHLDRVAGTPAGAAHAFAGTYWWVVAFTAAAIVPAWVLMRYDRRRHGDGAPSASDARTSAALAEMA